MPMCRVWIFSSCLFVLYSFFSCCCFCCCCCFVLVVLVVRLVLNLRRYGKLEAVACFGKRASNKTSCKNCIVEFVQHFKRAKWNQTNILFKHKTNRSHCVLFWLVVVAIFFFFTSCTRVAGKQMTAATLLRVNRQISFNIQCIALVFIANHGLHVWLLGIFIHFTSKVRYTFGMSIKFNY